MSKILRKIRNLCEILSLPCGLHLKLTEKDFSFADLRVCQTLLAGGVRPSEIFDIGANVGQFALAATTTWPDATIRSYEPVRSAFVRLEQLSIRHKKITPRQVALGMKAGQAEMHITNFSQSSSMLELHRNHLEAYPEVRESNLETVDVRTLESELTKANISKPTLLKLDVQGYESEVIKSAGDSLKDFQWIFLETTTRPMYQGESVFEEIQTDLTAGGFRFVGPIYIHFTPLGLAAQFDALFERQE